MNETEIRQKVVAIMQSWVGIREGTAQHKAIVDLYNQYMPHPRGYKLTYNDAWCAATVSAAAIKAGYTDIMPVECSCSELIKLYKARGRWIENDAHIPNPGDLIIYDWQDSGKGDNTGAPDHIGMVERVTGKTIIIIEGNCDNAVKRRTMTVDGRYIRGYACPDYASKIALTPAQQTVQHAVSDGVITMPDYWIDVLNGKKTPSAANVKSLIDKYHEVVGRGV